MNAPRVVLPHRHEILWTDDQRFEHLIVAHHPRDRRSDAGFPEADDISDEERPRAC